MTAVESPISRKLVGFQLYMAVAEYFKWAIGLAAGLYVVGTFIIVILTITIEVMYSYMNKKIANESGQGRGKTLAIVQGKQKKIREKHMISIERMERIKQTLISIIPFMKNR